MEPGRQTGAFNEDQREPEAEPTDEAAAPAAEAPATEQTQAADEQPLDPPASDR